MGEGIKLPVLNGLGRTNRIDNWLNQPIAMGVALTAAMLYTAWRLFLYPDSIYYELAVRKLCLQFFLRTSLNGNCSDSRTGTILRG